MSQIIKLPEVLKDFVNRFSGANFSSYWKYAEYRESIKNGTVETYLSFVQNMNALVGSLQGKDLEEIRNRVYQNLKISQGEGQFISLGTQYSFPIYTSNGNPSVFSSISVFQNKLMLEEIIKQEWEYFGKNELTVDFTYYERSVSRFLNPSLRLEKENEPFSNSPVFLAIVKILNEGADKWRRYEKKDFELQDSKHSSVARDILKDFPLVGPTLADDLALWLKMCFHSKSGV